MPLPLCAICGRHATCIGAYEGAQVSTPACDFCCGHGCEDGYCTPIIPVELVATAPPAPLPPISCDEPFHHAFKKGD